MATTTSEKIYTLGLSEILFGEIAEDGGMGTSLAAIGYTKEDSCTFEQDDPEDTEFMAEEVEDPVYILSKAGKINFAFELMNPSLDVIKDLFGGDIADGKWNAPDKLVNCEKSVKLVSDQGYDFEIPRMKLTPKIVGGFSKTGMMTISIKGVVMQPTKSGVSKLSIGTKAGA